MEQQRRLEVGQLCGSGWGAKSHENASTDRLWRQRASPPEQSMESSGDGAEGQSPPRSHRNAFKYEPSL